MESVYHEPRTRFVAEFMGQADFVPGRIMNGGVETLLGVVPAVLTHPIGTAVDVMARPDDVKLAVDDAGNGRILSRQFLGPAYLYRVALVDGSVIHSWQPHQNRLTVGTAVAATIYPEHTLRYFVKNDAATPWS